MFTLTISKSHPRRLCASLCLRPKKGEWRHACVCFKHSKMSLKEAYVCSFAQYQRSEKNKLMCLICIKIEIYLSRSKTCRRSVHGLSLRFISKNVSIKYHAQFITCAQLPSLKSSLARLIKRSHVVHRASSLHRGDPPFHRGEATTSPRSHLPPRHVFTEPQFTTCMWRSWEKPSSYLLCVCESRSGLDVKENPV